MTGARATAGELVGPVPVPPTSKSVTDRIAALEWRQAMLMQRLAGDAVIAGKLDEGGELHGDWLAALEWARAHYPLPNGGNGHA